MRVLEPGDHGAPSMVGGGQGAVRALGRWVAEGHYAGVVEGGTGAGGQMAAFEPLGHGREVPIEPCVGEG